MPLLVGWWVEGHFLSLWWEWESLCHQLSPAALQYLVQEQLQTPSAQVISGGRSPGMCLQALALSLPGLHQLSLASASPESLRSPQG